MQYSMTTVGSDEDQAPRPTQRGTLDRVNSPTAPLMGRCFTTWAQSEAVRAGSGGGRSAAGGRGTDTLPATTTCMLLLLDPAWPSERSQPH